MITISKNILAPTILLDKCKNLSKSSPYIKHSILGYSEQNNPIDLFYCGSGDKTVLFYGFPDPGEAVGGTLIYNLMLSLSEKTSKLHNYEIKWLFIPCLNFDDQPCNGKGLEKVFRDKNKREVDWCLSNPRPETVALVDLINLEKPILTYALHDEYHCNKNIPLYFVITRKIPKSIANDLRSIAKKYRYTINNEYRDIDMGNGILLAKTIGNKYHNSTFSVQAKYGQTIICEVSKQQHLNDSDLIKCQLDVGIYMIEAILNNI